MGKRFGPIRRFFATLGLTLGMALALPGCGNKVQTAQQMSQSVADQTDDFVKALQNGDVKTMKEIRDEVKDKQKELDKEENRRIDEGEDITDIMPLRVILKNQDAYLSDLISKYEKNNNTIPKSSDFWGNIADGVGGEASAVYDFLDGDPIYDTTAIVTEYVKQNNDYADLALSDQELFQVWYGKDFNEVYAIRGDNALGSYVLEQLYNMGYTVGRGFKAGRDKFRDGLIAGAEANSENADGSHDFHYFSDEREAEEYRKKVQQEEQAEIDAENGKATPSNVWDLGDDYVLIENDDGTYTPVLKSELEGKTIISSGTQETADDEPELG